MVAASKDNAFKQLMDKNEISYELKFADVQKLIDDETNGNVRAKRRQRESKMGWDYYARYSEIEEFVDGLHSTNDITVSVETIGSSFEGRNIRWISSATATWIINELVTRPFEYTDVLNGIDWYIVPLLNPDGYEYSHTTERFWRKTRSVIPGSSCKGVDPNRNFPFQFGGERTSPNPCSEIYRGSKPLSQNEAVALSNLMKRLLADETNVLSAYISIHAYGQYWFFPWGWKAGLYTDDFEEQLSLGLVVQAMKEVHGTNYTTGTAADILYPVGGASDDYGRNLGIKYTVTVELRNTENYLLNPSEIVPNAEELMAALKVVAARVRRGTESYSQALEAGIRRYDGYEVLSVIPDTLEKLGVLRHIHDSNDGSYDFWTDPVLNRKVDIMVAPELQEEFKQLLEKNGMAYKTKVNNVQSLINQERAANEKARLRNGNGKEGWDYYMRHNEIEEFIRSRPSTGDITVSVETIGTSYEGRNITAVKLSTSPTNSRGILIDANIHAREWITSATATWIINEFVTKPAQYGDLLDGVDYYIIPMVNPDGYEHCHTADRMWRKTRSVNAGSSCLGCDPNRNFPFQFGGEGTSSVPCSDIFKGDHALSESETKALSDYIVRLAGDENVDVRAYLTFHSYGQLWLLPWGYTAGTYPDDYEDQLSLGQAAIAALAGVHNTQYVTGSGADVLYGVGGASDDYGKFSGIKYSVTVEMRDDDEYGFVLPPDQIIPNAQEIMAALRVVAARVRDEA
ncbi:Carboxypeptidase B [Orchesella cincta]|uniref:Zinc carboxypeptidase A 1 n=1 Tax=Orchesella cincta TaxID=48709 RepID=A0A1D2MNZ6_ORCCI|nr:Carboxypeptidase B [Orchesella cincta]